MNKLQREKKKKHQNKSLLKAKKVIMQKVKKKKEIADEVAEDVEENQRMRMLERHLKLTMNLRKMSKINYKTLIGHKEVKVEIEGVEVDQEKINMNVKIEEKTIEAEIEVIEGIEEVVEEIEEVVEEEEDLEEDQGIVVVNGKVEKIHLNVDKEIVAREELAVDQDLVHVVVMTMQIMKVITSDIDTTLSLSICAF